VGCLPVLEWCLAIPTGAWAAAHFFNVYSFRLAEQGQPVNYRQNEKVFS